MRKVTFVVAALMIIVCTVMNIVQTDVSAMGIARGLMADMRAGISDDDLGDAIGKTKEGRRSIAAYWEAHALLHEVKVYKGLPDDHIPLIEAFVLNLNHDGYTESSNSATIAKFLDDSRKTGDSWERNY